MEPISRYKAASCTYLSVAVSPSIYFSLPDKNSKTSSFKSNLIKRSHHHHTHLNSQVKSGEDVWTVRRKMIRSFVKPQIKSLIKEKKEKIEKGLTDNDIKERNKKENLE
jgi:hypothetical protein